MEKIKKKAPKLLFWTLIVISMFNIFTASTNAEFGFGMTLLFMTLISFTLYYSLKFTLKSIRKMGRSIYKSKI